MTQHPTIDHLVPHRSPMLLVDRIVSEREGVTVAEHTIGADHVFLVPGKGVPTYAAFEAMAQAICATDGLRRWRMGQGPELGFLLGCRRYSARRDWLQPGEVLTIESKVLLEGETASYECRVIDAAGEEVSHGVVNVFQPEDIAGYLEGTRL